MDKRLGVIDIGTNTFHLLIVNWDTTEQTFTPLFRKRIFVKLGTANLGYIDEDAYQRGIIALQEFSKILSEYTCKKTIAFGTSAIRNASNANAFCHEVKQNIGIDIKKISGQREAELIYKGIKMSFPFDQKVCLIMDIGGGSVEFIIANSNQVFYAESFKIGVGVLAQKFHFIDPIPTDKIEAQNAFLNLMLKPLFEKLESFNPKTIIGASGTFDVLDNILPNTVLSPSANILDTSNLHSFSELVLRSDLVERKKIDGIPDTRADLIVVALILVNFVLRKHNFDQLVVSKYSMKEGMLEEMMNAKNT